MALVYDENPPTMPPPIVTYTLIAVNVIIFLLSIMSPGLLYPGATTFNDVISELGMTPAEVVTGNKLYTLLTSMFLHAGLTHILGNMLYLFVFGDNVESAMGRTRYTIFYLLSGLGATVFHIAALTVITPGRVASAYATYGVNPWLVPAVGASGAISGVLAAYLLAFPSTELRMIFFVGPFPVAARMPAGVYILLWFVFQAFYAILSFGQALLTGVAFWAHIGGFLTGLALAPFMINKNRLRIILVSYYY